MLYNPTRHIIAWAKNKTVDNLKTLCDNTSMDKQDTKPFEPEWFFLISDQGIQTNLQMTEAFRVLWKALAYMGTEAQEQLDPESQQKFYDVEHSNAMIYLQEIDPLPDSPDEVIALEDEKILEAYAKLTPEEIAAGQEQWRKMKDAVKKRALEQRQH